MSDRKTMENIGDTLRLAREAKEMSISAAAMHTHLSPSVIEKLESNCFSEIGVPVFTRGYLISYARFLGVNEAEISDSFNQLRHKPTELHISKANIASYSRPVRHGRIRSWLIVIFLLALAAVIAVEVVDSDSWLMLQFKQAFPEKLSGMVVQTFLNKEKTPPQESGEKQDIDLRADPSVPLADQAPKLILESTEVFAENAVSQEIAPSLPSAPPASESAEVATVSPISLTRERVSPQTIVLQVTGENWVEVRNRENEVVFSRIFAQGERIELAAQGAPYIVNTGRPFDLQLSIAGQDTPLDAYRIEGSQRKFRIDLDR